MTLTFDETCICEVYSVEDLLSATPDSPALRPEQLEVAVKGLVEPALWEDPNTYALNRDQLMIQQQPFVHDRIKSWLQRERSVRR